MPGHNKGSKVEDVSFFPSVNPVDYLGHVEARTVKTRL